MKTLLSASHSWWRIGVALQVFVLLLVLDPMAHPLYADNPPPGEEENEKEPCEETKDEDEEDIEDEGDDEPCPACEGEEDEDDAGEEEDECSGSGSKSKCEECGDEEAAAGSVSYSLSLGKVLTPKGGLEKASTFKFDIYEQEAGSQVFDRPALARAQQGQPKGAELIGDNGSSADNAPVRQVLTQQALADIQPSANGYSVRLFARGQVGAKSGGVYALSGTPIKTVTIRNPDGATVNNRVEVYSVDNIGTAPAVKTFRWSKTQNASNASQVQWKLEQFAGNTQQTGGATLVKRTVLDRTVLGGAERRFTQTRTVEVAGSGGGTALALVKKSQESYAYYTGRKPSLLERRKNPDSAQPVVTTRTYYTNSSNPASYGKVQSVRASNGAWKDYSYSKTTAGALTTAVASGQAGSPVGNASLGKLVTKTVDAQNQSFSSHKVEIAGNVVRSTQIGPAASGGGVVKSTMRLSGSGTPKYRVAAFAPSIASGVSSGGAVIGGKVSRIAYSNGRVASYSYSAGSAGQVVRTKLKGVATAQGTVSSGMQTVVKSSATGRKQEEARYDVATNVKLYSKVADMSTADALGRPQKVIYNDDPNDYEQRRMGCCGIEYARHRDGREVTFVYDALKRPTTTVSSYPNGSQEALIATHNGLTERQTLTANGQNTLVKETTRDLAGQVVSEKTPDSNGDGLPEETAYARENLASTTKMIETRPDGGQVITETYADGKTKSITGSGVADVKYEYGSDADGEFTKEIRLSATGGQEEWTKSYRDEGGRVVKVVGASGAVRTWEYEGRELTKAVDADGVTTLYRYDGAGRLSLAAIDMNRNGQVDFGGPDRITENLVTAVADPVLGACTKTVTQVYPEDGNATPKVVSTKYESAADLGSRIESFGRVTTVAKTKPVNGMWTVTTTYPDTTKQEEEYANGKLWRTTFKDSAGAQVTQTTLAYDDFGRVKSSTDARTGATDFEYYPDGSLWKVISPHKSDGVNRDATIFTRDAMGRVIGVTYPNGTLSHTKYDHRSNIVKQWGAQTYPQRYEYDEQGRMTKLFTFRSITDNSEPGDAAAGDVTAWSYFPDSGLPSGKIYADGKGPAYTYTNAGRLRTRTWARKINGSPLVTTYSYNNASEVEGIDYSDATPDVGFIYTRMGHTLQVSNAANITSYGYDPAMPFRLLTETTTSGALSRVISRGYDTLGRSGGLTVLSGGAAEHQVAYGYDIAGRLGNISRLSGASAAATFTYGFVPNSTGIIGSMTSPVHTVANTYESNRDALDGKENRLRSTGTPLVSGFEYTVNSLGQRKDVSYSGSAFGGVGSFNVYVYDDLGQVTAGKRYAGGTPASPQNPVASQQFAYVFDPIGNRQSASDGATSNTYSANALNQYEAIDSAALTYDEDGNLLSDGLQSYQWDAENRLIKVTRGDVEVACAYDGLRRRVRRTVKTNGSITFDRAFLYDGWNVAAEYDLPSGGIPTLHARNLWGLDLSGSLQGAGGVGGLLERVSTESGDTTAAAYRFTYDGNGNVSELLDNNGNVAAHYEYGPFGETVRATGALAQENPFRFSTKYQDHETGLLYYGYRYYEPETGRWLSRDPISENGGSNLYAFSLNQPTNGIDLLGLSYSGCDWPDHTKDWLRQNCKEIHCFADKWKVPPRDIANSIMEENAGNGTVDSVQDDLVELDAVAGHLLTNMLHGIKNRNADVGPGNINIDSAMKELDRTYLPPEWQGWFRLTPKERFQLINDYLLSPEGTADIGSRLQKVANDEMKGVLRNVTDGYELTAMRTNAWREGPERLKARILPNIAKNPTYTPSSGNDYSCLKQRLDFIDQVLKACKR